MNTVLFNIHDVALLLRVGECSMLAMLLLAHRGSKPYSNSLLAVFLLLNAMVALHLLILWGEAFRFLAFKFSPNVFFIFNFAYFLEGPILLMIIILAMGKPKQSLYYIHRFGEFIN